LIDDSTGGQALEIARAGTQKSLVGNSANFHGAVRRDPLFAPGAPSAIAGSSVTFEPGARTAWHAHPVGQALVITAGLGWVQSWGRARQQVAPGDVVWIAPDEKHWHGATSHTSMSHIAITEARDGQNVEWLEQVDDRHFGSEHWSETEHG
jgi:quercetin dioxygenase-like cupin family protein